jgi:hypothetical protein
MTLNYICLMQSSDFRGCVTPVSYAPETPECSVYTPILFPCPSLHLAVGQHCRQTWRLGAAPRRWTVPAYTARRPRRFARPPDLASHDDDDLMSSHPRRGVPSPTSQWRLGTRWQGAAPTRTPAETSKPLARPWPNLLALPAASTSTV